MARWMKLIALMGLVFAISECRGVGYCDNGLGPCASDEDCRDDCRGTCQLTGIRCNDDTPCSGVEGRCADLQCTGCDEGDPACEEGRSCISDWECGSGWCGSGVCTTPGHGRECDRDEQCIDFCDGGCRVGGLACPWDSGCSEHGTCIGLGL